MAPEIRMRTTVIGGVEYYSRERVREEMRGTSSAEFAERWREFLLHFGGDRLWFDAAKTERIFAGWGWH